MGVGSATTYRATRRRIRRYRDRIAVLAEHRHIGGVLRHREGIARIGRHLAAVLRPADEGIARVGCRRQRTGLALVVGASTRHRTAIAWTGRGRDGI